MASATHASPLAAPQPLPQSIAPNISELTNFPNLTLLDHEYRNVLDLGEPYRGLHDRCQRALRESVWREERNLTWPHLLTDPLDGVRVGTKAQANDPRIFYHIGASRPTAAIMVSRLLLALYHPSHLFIVHVDLKADAAVTSELSKLTASHPNIHIMRHRRLVQWGAWTMVLTLLDAIHSALAAGLEFDFVVNLSDVDVALRTNDEIVDFLRPYAGRQFVQVHTGTGEWLEKARNFTCSQVVVECGGYGYVSINSSHPIELGGGPQCCFGRGGPVVYANTSRLHMSEARAVQASERRLGPSGDGSSEGDANGASVPTKGDASTDKTAGSDGDDDGDGGDGLTLHTGSQWIIIDRAFATYLVRDPRAASWIRVFERRFLSDEAFVQTVLMHSPFRSSLVNHNMRYIYWPHFDGDPTAYWMKMGHSFIGGPQVVNATGMPAVLQSPYMFARKVDPTVDSTAVSLWDEWMAKKLRGERPDDQEILGGQARRTAAGRLGVANGDPLERTAAPYGAAGAAADGTRDDTTDGASDVPVAPRIARAPLRRVSRVTFEDGSTCDCAPDCDDGGTCCDDWPELCEQGKADEGRSGGAGGPPLPACPSPAHPPLASATRRGAPIRLTFLSHARYPLRLVYVPPPGGREVDMGVLRPRGAPLTVDARDSHAWSVRSWGGVSMLELTPSETRRTSTIDVHECELRGARRKQLHGGWR